MKIPARNMERSKSTAPVKQWPVLSQSDVFRNHGLDAETGSLSSEDTELLLREGQLDNGAPVRRVMSGVRMLLRDGRITLGDAAAAERFASDYSLGMQGASDPQRRGSSCRGDLHSFQLARLDAASRYREAKEAVGEEGEQLLMLFVVERKGLAAISRQLVHEDLSRQAVAAKEKAAADEAAIQLAMAGPRADRQTPRTPQEKKRMLKEGKLSLAAAKVTAKAAETALNAAKFSLAHPDETEADMPWLKPEKKRRVSQCKLDLALAKSSAKNAAADLKATKLSLANSYTTGSYTPVMVSERRLSPTPPAAIRSKADKRAETAHEAMVTRLAQTRAKGLSLPLIAAVKALSDFYSKQAANRSKSRKPYWRPDLSERRAIDPETGLPMVLYPTVYEAARTRLSAAT